jgi:hypothetical protein
MVHGLVFVFLAMVNGLSTMDFFYFLPTAMDYRPWTKKIPAFLEAGLICLVIFSLYKLILHAVQE